MLLPIDLTLVFPVVFAMEALSSQCETQTRQPPAVSLPNGLRLDMKAQGSPEIWNANGETLYWGKRTANMLRNEPLSRLTTQERKLAIFCNFLKDTLDHYGRPVAYMLDAPVFYGQGWMRFEWLPGREAVVGLTMNEGWYRAWHGTKLEALYSILYFGFLLESSAASAGERFLQDAPGVYLHKDSTQYKGTISGLCCFLPTVSFGQLSGRG